LIAGVPADLGDDVARLRGVRGDMDLAPDRLEPLLELRDQLRQALEVLPATALEILPAALEIKTFKGLVPASTKAGQRLNERFLQLVVVECVVDPARKVAPRFGQLGALRVPGPGTDPGACARDASCSASTTSAGVDAGARHTVPTHTTAR
jgi:hypothetical protein